ncbi:hypothetical protein ACQCVP_21100 [Rossellomorea vietnamensis]
MPVGSDQGASTFYTGAAEEAHRPPRGVVRVEWKSNSFITATIFAKTKKNRRCHYASPVF